MSVTLVHTAVNERGFHPTTTKKKQQKHKRVQLSASERHAIQQLQRAIAFGLGDWGCTSGITSVDRSSRSGSAESHLNEAHTCPKPHKNELAEVGSAGLIPLSGSQDDDGGALNTTITDGTVASHGDPEHRDHRSLSCRSSSTASTGAGGLTSQQRGAILRLTKITLALDAQQQQREAEEQQHGPQNGRVSINSVTVSDRSSTSPRASVPRTDLLNGKNGGQTQNHQHHHVPGVKTMLARSMSTGTPFTTRRWGSCGGGDSTGTRNSGPPSNNVRPVFRPLSNSRHVERVKVPPRIVPPPISSSSSHFFPADDSTGDEVFGVSPCPPLTTATTTTAFMHRLSLRGRHVKDIANIAAALRGCLAILGPPPVSTTAMGGGWKHGQRDEKVLSHQQRHSMAAEWVLPQLTPHELQQRQNKKQHHPQHPQQSELLKRLRLLPSSPGSKKEKDEDHHDAQITLQEHAHSAAASSESESSVPLEYFPSVYGVAAVPLTLQRAGLATIRRRLDGVYADIVEFMQECLTADEKRHSGLDTHRLQSR